MKINIEKEIYVPSGIYCDKCFEKKERDGRTYCNGFGGWLYAANDGTGRIVKCVNCFESIQKNNHREELLIMKPILFNTEMVRAILDGRKTVTRRVIDVPQGFKFLGWNMGSGYDIQYGYCSFISDNGITQIIRKPKYKINDVLYIRETFMEHYTYFISNCLPNPHILYKANFSDNEGLMGCGVDRWKPSIHMPKAYARLFLRVTDVRIERLQDITEYQAKAEGCYLPCYEVKTGKENSDNIALFKIIWNSTIHKSKMDQYGWNANPWVFVYEFEKISKEAAMEEENE